MIMRPLFIYKYEKKMIKKTDQFFSIFKTQGHIIEEDFKQQQIIKKTTKDLERRKTLIGEQL